MSVMRHCAIYKAQDGRWYVELAPGEHDGEEEAFVYGPFKDSTAAEDELEWHSNPGGYHWDESGNRPAPTQSPNGQPLQRPSRGNPTRPNQFTYRFR